MRKINTGSLLVIISAASLLDINMLWHRANKNREAGVKIGSSTYIMMMTDIAFTLLITIIGFVFHGFYLPLWIAFIVAYISSFAIRFIHTAINALFLYHVRRKAESAASKKRDETIKKELAKKNG